MATNGTRRNEWLVVTAVVVIFVGAAAMVSRNVAVLCLLTLVVGVAFFAVLATTLVRGGLHPDLPTAGPDATDQTW